MTTRTNNETIERLEEIRDEIKDLVREARGLVNGTKEKKAAEAYWIAHVLGALDDDHGYLGGSMTTMQDTIDALRGDDDDGDGDAQ